VASFARQVKAIAAGAEPLLRAGNLDSERDFTDVRDVVRAYRVSSNAADRPRPITLPRATRSESATSCNACANWLALPPRIERDPTRFRPDTLAPRIDATKLRTETGWDPACPRPTLRDILAAS